MYPPNDLIMTNIMVTIGADTTEEDLLEEE